MVIKFCQVDLKRITEWDLRGASLNTANAITGEVDLARPGQGDTRSTVMPATPGRSYTLEADVIVTAGYAKLDLNFLNAGGGWLTNNTAPTSGISATATTSSIQHLSATWTSPADTASVIIRLINNASGGSAQFDNVRLGVWEAPDAPYGTDLYYPDQLTAKISGLFSAGVLWRSGNSSPYELHYSGVLAGRVADVQHFQAPDTRTSTSIGNGEKRIIRVPPGNLFAFYFDADDLASNLKYKYSTNSGYTWKFPSSSTQPQTGQIVGDQQWTVVAARPGSTNYVYLIYTTYDGTNSQAKVQRGVVSGNSITWSSPTTLFTKSGKDGMFKTGATSAGGTTVWVAFEFFDNSAGAFKYRIWKVPTGGTGTQWSESLGPSAAISSKRFAMAMTFLGSTGSKMLFAYSRYEDNSIKYRVFSGSSWDSSDTTISAGMSTGKYKFISAASDKISGKAYLVYLSAGKTGSIKIVDWANDGRSWTTPTPTVSSATTWRMPVITVRPDTGKIDVYALGKNPASDTVLNVYKIDKLSGKWTAPTKPYGDNRIEIDELTMGWGLGGEYAPVTWLEGESRPSLGETFTIREAGIVKSIAFNFLCLKAATLLDQCTGTGTSPYTQFRYITPTDPAFFHWSTQIGCSNRIDFDYLHFWPLAHSFNTAKTFEFYAGAHLMKLSNAITGYEGPFPMFFSGPGRWQHGYFCQPRFGGGPDGFEFQTHHYYADICICRPLDFRELTFFVNLKTGYGVPPP